MPHLYPWASIARPSAGPGLRQRQSHRALGQFAALLREDADTARPWCGIQEGLPGGGGHLATIMGWSAVASHPRPSSPASSSADRKEAEVGKQLPDEEKLLRRKKKYIY